MTITWISCITDAVAESVGRNANWSQKLSLGVGHWTDARMFHSRLKTHLYRLAFNERSPFVVCASEAETCCAVYNLHLHYIY